MRCSEGIVRTHCEVNWDHIIWVVGNGHAIEQHQFEVAEGSVGQEALLIFGNWPEKGKLQTVGCWVKLAVPHDMWVDGMVH